LGMGGSRDNEDSSYGSGNKQSGYSGNEESTYGQGRSGRDDEY